MDKPVPNFTMVDLLADLKEQFPEFAKGSMTTREMAESLGISQKAMLKRLRPLKQQGLIRVTSKTITTINDRSSTVTAWAPVIREVEDDLKGTQSSEKA